MTIPIPKPLPECQTPPPPPKGEQKTHPQQGRAARQLPTKTQRPQRPPQPLVVHRHVHRPPKKYQQAGNTKPLCSTAPHTTNVQSADLLPPKPETLPLNNTPTVCHIVISNAQDMSGPVWSCHCPPRLLMVVCSPVPFWGFFLGPSAVVTSATVALAGTLPAFF